MKGINWAGVIAAVVVGQLIGFLWYGIVFEKQWVALSGVTPAGDMGAGMASGAVNQLVVAIGLSWLVNKTGTSGAVSGAATCLLAAIFFACTTDAMAYIYGGANTGLIPINFGYLMVSYALMGAAVAVVRLGSKSAAAA